MICNGLYTGLSVRMSSFGTSDGKSTISSRSKYITAINNYLSSFISVEFTTAADTTGIRSTTSVNLTAMDDESSEFLMPIIASYASISICYSSFIRPWII